MGISSILSITSAATHTSSEVMNFIFKPQKEPAPRAVGRVHVLWGSSLRGSKNASGAAITGRQTLWGAQLGAGGSPGLPTSRRFIFSWSSGLLKSPSDSAEQPTNAARRQRAVKRRIISVMVLVSN